MWTLPQKCPHNEVGAFLFEVVPVKDHRLVRERREGVHEEAADPARAIGDEQEGAQPTHAQQHGDVQALEERCTYATQVALAVLGHDPRGA